MLFQIAFPAKDLAPIGAHERGQEGFLKGGRVYHMAPPTA